MKATERIGDTSLDREQFVAWMNDGSTIHESHTNFAGEVEREMGKVELLQIVDHKHYEVEPGWRKAKGEVREQVFPTLRRPLGCHNVVYR